MLKKIWCYPLVRGTKILIRYGCRDNDFEELCVSVNGLLEYFNSGNWATQRWWWLREESVGYSIYHVLTWVGNCYPIPHHVQLQFHNPIKISYLPKNIPEIESRKLYFFSSHQRFSYKIYKKIFNDTLF